jgi:gluconolactonase
VTHYKTHRLNSPNDLVYSPEGHLYFTDPTYGLHSKHDFSIVGKELNHSGVYMVKADYLRMALESGEPTAYVRLLENKLSHPNGLAFSPDFSKLYIANSDSENSYINVYEVKDDGSLKRGSLFFNATEWAGQQCVSFDDSRQQCADTDAGNGPVDGLKVDIHGNIFASGPGGVVVLSPEGVPLGRLRFDRQVTNVAFGGDGRLYITAKDIVARLWVKTKPARIVGKLNM